MPLPFNPARATALARGLRIVEGGRAEARALALRKYAREVKAGGQTAEMARRAAESESYIPPRDVSVDVLGPEGYERTAQRTRATRFSPQATMEQEARGRHAVERTPPGYPAGYSEPTEDPRAWFGETATETQGKTRAAGRAAEDERLMQAFTDRYGWRPRAGADEVRGWLSPAELEELGFPEKP